MMARGAEENPVIGKEVVRRRGGARDHPRQASSIREARADMQVVMRHLQVGMGHDVTVTRRSRAGNDLMVTMASCQSPDSGQFVAGHGR